MPHIFFACKITDFPICKIPLCLKINEFMFFLLDFANLTCRFAWIFSKISWFSTLNGICCTEFPSPAPTDRAK